MQDQDRGRWDQAQITEGLSLVRTTPRRGNPGQYRLQAAIAAVHREAAHPAETDWPQIVALYRRAPSPVVALNHALAPAMVHGPAAGPRRLEAITELPSYRLWHAARATCCAGSAG